MPSNFAVFAWLLLLEYIQSIWYKVLLRDVINLKTCGCRKLKTGGKLLKSVVSKKYHDASNPASDTDHLRVYTVA